MNKVEFTEEALLALMQSNGSDIKALLITQDIKQCYSTKLMISSIHTLYDMTHEESVE